MGYIDVRGHKQGFDIEIAKWFARYAFGKANRVSFVCAPTPAREPLITSGRVDLVISTFTYTRDRDTRIDFSRAYYKAGGRLLVTERLADPLALRPRRPPGRDNERVDLRPVGAACFPNTDADRDRQPDERAAHVRPGAG